MTTGATARAWVVGPPPSAASAAHLEVPVTAERAPVSGGQRRDGAARARVRALAAAAHLRKGPEAAPSPSPSGWRRGAAPRDAQIALGRSHSVGATQAEAVERRLACK